MGHIAHISGKVNDKIIDKVLKANPLLESFGNAKTIRNDNSSRFGKFTQLQFNEFSKLVGSKCVTYLLEKSRVVNQNSMERNYHIFHEILAAPIDVKKALKLEDKTCFDFMYCSGGDTHTNSIEGISDSERYALVMSGLQLIGISVERSRQLLQILAGILYLGELQFIGKDGDSDKSNVDHELTDVNENVAFLLGLSNNAMHEKVTSRNIDVAGEEMVVPLTVEQAYDGRDALAKEIYSR